MDASNARFRMNPASYKVTKFSDKSLRDFKRYQVSLCLAFVPSFGNHINVHTPMEIQWVPQMLGSE